MDKSVLEMTKLLGHLHHAAAHVHLLFQHAPALSSYHRFAPAYYDWVYALMPSGRRNKKATEFVHKFSMDVIKTRRATLEKRKAEKMSPTIFVSEAADTSIGNYLPRWLHGDLTFLFALNTCFKHMMLMY